MTMPHKLSPEALQLVRDIIAGLEDPQERRREAGRARYKVLRMDDDARKTDNAHRAAQLREKYHGEPGYAKRLNAARWQREKARKGLAERLAPAPTESK